MFTLNTVVPWGRSFDEYCEMFALGDAERAGRIAGCADGPASFNAEGTARGYRIVSCDPLYACTADAIRRRIAETAPDVLAATRRNLTEFKWERFRSIDDLERVRLRAMGTFLDDFDRGLAEGRYVAASLPSLPFANRTFALALCSHFLFLYDAQFDVDFHVAAISEMGRIAAEVRIFPLLALGAVPSRHVGPVTECLETAGFSVSIERVAYEFQRGGNEMMRVRREIRG